MSWAYALSGCAAVVYVTAWARSLRRAPGGTRETHALVLSIIQRNRQVSDPGSVTGTGFQGDAAFADYSIILRVRQALLIV